MLKRLNKHIITYVCIIAISLTFLLSVCSIWKYHHTSQATSANTTSTQMRANATPPSQSNGQKQPSKNQANTGQKPTNKSQSSINSEKNRPSHANAKNSNNMMARPFGSSESTNTTSSKLAFALYSGLFFTVLIGTFFLIHKRKFMHSHLPKKLVLPALLLTGLFIRIAVSPWVAGQPFDLNFFKTWASAASNGLSTFYSASRSDYPPFYMYVLYIVGKINTIPGMSAYFSILVKLPPILADVVTAYLLYRISRRKLNQSFSMFIAAFYIFNPAIIINSTFWGQVDSFFTLLLVLAIFLLTNKKIIWSAVIFTLAVLMKPQGIIFLPVLFFELVRLKSLRTWMYVISASIVTSAIVILPFWGNQEALWVLKLYSSTVGEYPYASVNAFNFFGLIGANYISDETKFLFLTYHQWGLLFIILTTAFAWFAYWKKKSTHLAFLAGTLLIAGTFTFSTSMHERYLFPAAALAILAFCYIKDQRLLWLAGGYSFTIFMNTFEVYYGTFEGLTAQPYGLSLIFTSLLNVLLFILLIKITLDSIKRKTLDNHF